MNQSENIAELAAALSMAQEVMAGAKKDAKGNFGKFADLTSCWEALRGPLADHGLAVIQTTSNIGLDGVNVITTLAHKSGQWIRGELFLPAMKKDPQGFGSALTYARRYALASITGLAPADDDAQVVTDSMRSQKPKEEQAKPVTSISTAIKPEQAAEIRKVLATAGIKEEDFKTSNGIDNIPAAAYQKALASARDKAMEAMGVQA